MSTHDFTFAVEGAPSQPWEHLLVVRFRGHEALSSLYRYEITLLSREPDADIDPQDLIGKRATLRIDTLTEPPYKVVHGVIAEAEEISSVPGGMLYRVILRPPLVRAGHRTRCRIFLEKTIRAIVDAVLQGDRHLQRKDCAVVEPESGSFADFAPAAELFTWRIVDPSRIDDVRARPYCVQYNESDLAFVARLLEEEGISYHFESGDGACLLVLSDTDKGKARVDPFLPLGADVDGREVTEMKLGARLRERRVRLADYDWRKPVLDLSVEVNSTQDDLFEEHWPGGYAEGPEQGAPLAKARLDRHHSEASFATGRGHCRVLSAGSVFALEHAKGRYEGEYVVTAMDVEGEQRGVLPVWSAESSVPLRCAFEAVRRGKGNRVEESRFRPARVTPRPRIEGAQTAFVTAEPTTQGAEIHVGGPPGNEIGCVRVRFGWDRDSQRHAKEPTSCWVRVSQTFAGAAEGAMWHPRVGVEVIVEHIDGNPDRPIVTGRVYNGDHRPPGPSNGAPTVSGWKSFSSPGGGTFNELTFDDAAGKEQIKLHAGKNWNSHVGHDRTEHVTNHSTSSIGVNRTESTGGDRTTSVKGNNTEAVDGDETITVSANQTTAIGNHRNITVGADQTLHVAGNRATSIGADERTEVFANQKLSVGGNRSVEVAGDRSESVAGSGTLTIVGNQSVSVSGSSEETISGSRSASVSGAVSLDAAGDVTETVGANLAISTGANTAIQAGAELSLIAAAQAVLQGANVSVGASGEIVLGVGGSAIRISGGGIEIMGGAIKIAGGAIDLSGGVIKHN